MLKSISLIVALLAVATLGGAIDAELDAKIDAIVDNLESSNKDKFIEFAQSMSIDDMSPNSEKLFQMHLESLQSFVIDRMSGGSKVERNEIYEKVLKNLVETAEKVRVAIDSDETLKVVREKPDLVAVYPGKKVLLASLLSKSLSSDFLNKYLESVLDAETLKVVHGVADEIHDSDEFRLFDMKAERLRNWVQGALTNYVDKETTAAGKSNLGVLITGRSKNFIKRTEKLLATCKAYRPTTELAVWIVNAGYRPQLSSKAMEAIKLGLVCEHVTSDTIAEGARHAQQKA